jgi:hypothetical protein|tara:strand:+ start:47 stop:148 length:102 start_codon:yes stop_codon:yes gene_type:complete
LTLEIVTAIVLKKVSAVMIIQAERADLLLAQNL